jgi:putative ABC transport system permease protein
MNALGFAWRSLVRQPARALLGILGVAAVGALLLDMLLLSQGLIVSMRDLLDRTGYDARVTATEALPRNGPPIQHVRAVLSQVTSLPSVRSALAVRYASARVEPHGAAAIGVSFEGVGGNAPFPWTVLQGRDVRSAGEVVIDQELATTLGIMPGATIALRPSCSADWEALPPARLHVAGIAQFPFDLTDEQTVGATLDTVAAACGGNDPDDADLIMITSVGDTDRAVADIQRVRPDLKAMTNEQVLGRIQQTGFTYFRQISSVLTTVTLSFALLLITVLLTVSVNQRLGEIAALRALGFSRRRVVADVFCESALIVGIGGVLSLPIGGLLAVWLDRILKRMPGIPVQLHFFVFEPDALALHLLLLAATAVIAALYPMRIVARLPIAATLRNEVTG